MAEFKKRTEMAYKYMVELQVGRIDEIKTDNGHEVKVVKAMGQPCAVTQDLNSLAQAAPENLEFYEIASIPDYAKFVATGKTKTGRPIYWIGNMDKGIFVMRPKEFYFNPTDAFSKLYSDLRRREQFVTESYARDVTTKKDLIKTSLYLSSLPGYNEANTQFKKILEQQKQK